MQEVKTTIGQNDYFPELLQLRSDDLELFNGNDFFSCFHEVVWSLEPLTL